MSSFADISIRLRADLKQFSSSMQNVERGLKKTGKRFERIGRNLSTNFTAPVLAGLALVTKGTEELRSDLGRLETNAELAGESIGFLRDQLKEAQAVTGETDSSVEGLSNLLAAGFKGESLTQALNNISGAAIKFSDTLKFEGVADGLQETLATGAAIGPFAELLERSGINLDMFNAGLQESIKQGTAQNFVLQTLASTGLAEVNAKFRENNKDVTDARKAQLSFQIAMADLARVVQPIVNKLINFVTGLVEAFNNLSPEVKNVILVIGGLVAALGPVLSALGFLMTTVIPGLITAFGAISAPVLAVIAVLAGIGVVIYKYWEPIKKTLIDIANYFIDLYNESIIVRAGVETIIGGFKLLFRAGKLVFDGLLSIIAGWWRGVKSIFSNFGAAFKALITRNFEELPGILDNVFSDIGENFAKTITSVGKDIENFTTSVEQDMQNAVDNVVKRKKLEFITDLEIDNVKVSENAKQQLGNALVGAGSGRSQLPVNTLDSAGAIQSESNFMPEVITDANLERIQMFDERLRGLQETAQIVSNSVASAFQSMAGRFVESLELADTGFQGFVKNIIATSLELIQQLITNAIRNIAIRKAEAVSNAIAGATSSAAATGPGAIFTQPAFLATMIGGVLSAFAAIPKFANGGVVSGPTLGLVGEYAGARNNPEVIAPLDKLKGLLADTAMNTAPIVLDTRISGQDLILSQNRANSYRRRRS